MSKPTIYSRLLPTGAIILWGGVDMPNGFLLCNGASVSRSDYPDLAAALGETGTTFSLPDYRDRVPQGAGTVSPNVSLSAGLPEISGTFRTRQGVREDLEDPAHIVTIGSGAFSIEDWEGATTQLELANSTGNTTRVSFSASSSSSAYGSSTTVQPPAITAHFLIKA